MENEEIMEGLKNPKHAYDFICNNYWKMSKEDLKNIAKELIYILTANENEYTEEYNEFLENLECYL